MPAAFVDTVHVMAYSTMALRTPAGDRYQVMLCRECEGPARVFLARWSEVRVDGEPTQVAGKPESPVCRACSLCGVGLSFPAGCYVHLAEGQAGVSLCPLDRAESSLQVAWAVWRLRSVGMRMLTNLVLQTGRGGLGLENWLQVVKEFITVDGLTVPAVSA